MEFKASELILNPDGSIFHLKLHPDQIADTLILVGDPGRVGKISDFFETIELKTANREFVTHTGTFNKRRITVMSSGIGTDNMDIVLNELDALVNIDLEKRILKPERKSLRLVRIGTTGGIQPDIPVGSLILSRYAGGFDPVLNFYARRNEVCDPGMEKAFREHTQWDPRLPDPYFVRSSDELFDCFKEDLYSGITISAPGFYGPQGRTLRLEPHDAGLNRKLERFRYGGLKILNYEMESSALFGLSALLGHRAVTLCTVIASRASMEFMGNYKALINKLINFTLERLCR